MKKSVCELFFVIAVRSFSLGVLVLSPRSHGFVSRKDAEPTTLNPSGLNGRYDPEHNQEKIRGQPNSGEEINWQVISSGGTEGSSIDYVVRGTVGQTAVGRGYSPDHNVSHGFRQRGMGGVMAATAQIEKTHNTIQGQCVVRMFEFKARQCDCDTAGFLISLI